MVYFLESFDQLLLSVFMELELSQQFQQLIESEVASRLIVNFALQLLTLCLANILVQQSEDCGQMLN
jgi:hypothetical protein